MSDELTKEQEQELDRLFCQLDGTDSPDQVFDILKRIFINGKEADNAALRAQLAACEMQKVEMQHRLKLIGDGRQLEVDELKQQLAAAQAEVKRMTEQQKSLWLRFTVCTSHEEFCEDLDELIMKHDDLESRTARLERALTVIQEQAIGSADKVVCLNRLDFVREHAKQALAEGKACES